MNNENRCEVGGQRYAAVTVMNEICTGCAGQGDGQLCDALSPCSPEERADGLPCIWRRVATVEYFTDSALDAMEPPY